MTSYILKRIENIKMADNFSEENNEYVLALFWVFLLQNPVLF